MGYAPALRSARPSAAFTLIPLIAICLTLAGCGINNIPTYEQNAKAAWSEVLNQYKRRADLIPNLVETVKGFADQERTVLTDVVEARAKATQVQIEYSARHPDQPRGDAEIPGRAEPARRRARQAARRRRALSRHQVGAELPRPAEPDRGHREPHRHRPARLHQAVRAYNTELTTFPGRIWRTVMYPASKEMATFDIAPEEMKAPKVDFGKPK